MSAPRGAGTRDHPLSPSTLVAGGTDRCCVAGRIVSPAEAGVCIADAFRRVPVRLTPQSEVPQLGDLVVLEGRFDGQALCETRVLRAVTPARPPNEVGLCRHRDGTLLPGETHRLLHEGVGRALRRRAEVQTAIRAHFAEEGFLEVETPARVLSPGMDLHLDPFPLAEASPRFLNTSPEYHMKRLLTGGVPRCFQIARCFRRGEAGSRHNPEFTMLEWYRAYERVDAIIEDTEAIIVRALSFGARDDRGSGDGVGQLKLDRPFERLTLSEAFLRFADVDEDRLLELVRTDEERYFHLLAFTVEPALAKLGRPVVLHRFPIEHASLARAADDDARFCERFEVYALGLELCNGFGELTDPVEQRARFEAQQALRLERGQPVLPLDERFLDALAEGMPPASGNALGLDRLVALSLGDTRIDGAIAFPEPWL